MCEHFEKRLESDSFDGVAAPTPYTRRQAVSNFLNFTFIRICTHDIFACFDHKEEYLIDSPLFSKRIYDFLEASPSYFKIQKSIERSGGWGEDNRVSGRGDLGCCSHGFFKIGFSYYLQSFLYVVRVFG